MTIRGVYLLAVMPSHYYRRSMSESHAYITCWFRAAHLWQVLNLQNCQISHKSMRLFFSALFLSPQYLRRSFEFSSRIFLSSIAFATPSHCPHSRQGKNIRNGLPSPVFDFACRMVLNKTDQPHSLMQKCITIALCWSDVKIRPML